MSSGESSADLADRTVRLVGAVARESKAALIAAYPSSGVLDNGDINRLMFSAQGGQSELAVSKSYYAEICKYLSGEPYHIFQQHLGDGDGFARIPHTYEFEPGEASSVQALAAHALNWSRGTPLPLAVLGEPKMPSSDREVPSIALHLDILMCLASSRSILHTQMADRLGEIYDHAANPKNYLGRLAQMGVIQVDPVKRGESILAITPGSRVAIRGLLAIVESMQADPDSFEAQGRDLREKFLAKPTILRKLIAKTQIGNKRMNGNRVNYREKVDQVVQFLDQHLIAEPFSLLGCARTCGIDPSDLNRMHKLHKKLESDSRICVIRNARNTHYIRRSES